MTDSPGVPPAVQSLFTPDEIGSLLALRRDLHQHPELSWNEDRTARRLERALHDLGIGESRRVAGTGVVAEVPGRQRGPPRIAIRGDIDALPIQEATGLPFASQNPGVMHACGHDVHATWAIGAAMLLRRTPAQRGVLIVLQPAEEVGAGAPAILASGALEGVEAIFGGHVDRRFPVGTVVADPGPLAASADTFHIEIDGRGAHGARPHEGADPIVGAAALVSALHTIVSRRIDPSAPAVLTVGSMHGGSAPNVIPERVTLEGTLRATRRDVREALHAGVREITASLSAAYGLTARVRLDRGTPPLVNPERETAWARAAAERVLGPASVVPLGFTNMAGEDFAFYLERMGGCFLRIGAQERGGEPTAAHSPRFAPAEGSILVGAAVLAECAREASG
ncbi:MAG TPA: M20 family metallopeptidase [Gemmatimonadaceae bacterium]|nr:M20 family metallopeptidase [Gemmatimonadaceae bacterium]